MVLTYFDSTFLGMIDKVFVLFTLLLEKICHIQ